MKPAFYATTCRKHNKVNNLICGCPFFVIHRRISLFTEKQIKQAYHQGQVDKIKMINKTKVEDIGK
jgi:hypothetical protein